MGMSLPLRLHDELRQSIFTDVGVDRSLVNFSLRTRLN
jgi:hypothetical protein